mgnify:CR=1 FL=1|jgi:hypothetical protein|tara:strand:- start:246 stop:500 length:255 start_codon:yes stop_codon:yes gene_type:complete
MADAGQKNIRRVASKGLSLSTVRLILSAIILLLFSSTVVIILASPERGSDITLLVLGALIGMAASVTGFFFSDATPPQSKPGEG